MLDSIFNPIYTSDFNFTSYIFCTLASVVLGLVIAAASGFKNKQSKSVTLSLILLPAIVQTVIMLVNGSVGTGIAVMGAFSLVRFRSVPGSAKEIVAIFLAMATGLATAMGYVLLAVVFVVIICIVMILSTLIGKGEKDDLCRELRITIPEDLSYAHCFDDLFLKYTQSTRLVTVKTTNMGSLYKLIYDIKLKNDDSTQAFIDDLRCRNGNLEISIAVRATAESTL